jgi:hypothetical protein
MRRAFRRSITARAAARRRKTCPCRHAKRDELLRRVAEVLGPASAAELNSIRADRAQQQAFAAAKGQMHVVLRPAGHSFTIRQAAKSTR